MRIYFFFFLSFLEGASVMAAELLGAKMMSPYFGSSLYVWASVLGITLGGLALGYFSGGWISQKKNNERYLYFVLIASAVFLILMPLSAKEIMIRTAGFSLISSIMISSIIFLLPPVFFMGMVSPMIVQCIQSFASGQAATSGKAAGTVFAVSTLGGILSTFLFGFYLIPEFGLAVPSVVTGIVLGIVPFIKLIMNRNFYSLIFILTVFFSFLSSRSPSENSGTELLYSREGLLGQILVVDYPVYEGNLKTKEFQRILFVNRSTQTVVTYRRNGEKELFEYVNIISERTAGPSERSRALVLGLGGGSVANKLIESGFNVDAVELDARMVRVAKDYFDLDEKVNIWVDDARHFILSQKSFARAETARSGGKVKSQKKYNLIVLDAFVGEVNPHHLFTTEFFEEIKPLLSDSGQFFINGNGYWTGETGKGMRSVCKTLLASGFDVELIPAGETEDYRNLLFLAACSKSGQGVLMSRSITGLDLSDAVILTDEKPQLEILNAEANKRWREACMKYFLEGYYSRQDRLLFN